MIYFPELLTPREVHLEQPTAVSEITPIIERLKTYGFHPVAIGPIKKTPFVNEGLIVALDGDNIQIFPYASHFSAEYDAALFFAQYPNATTTGGGMNVYQKGNLLIFYMGSRENIFSALQDIADMPNNSIASTP